MKTLTPNDLGKKFLVEDCKRIEISRFIKITKKNLREILLKTELEYGNLNIKISTSNTYKKSFKYWFQCPNCTKRVGVLYVHPITSILGCRTCLNLEYRNRRYKGMTENELLK